MVSFFFSLFSFLSHSRTNGKITNKRTNEKKWQIILFLSSLTTINRVID